jgi:hypothetical protein
MWAGNWVESGALLNLGIKRTFPLKDRTGFVKFIAITIQEINAEMHFNLTTVSQIPPVFKSWLMDPT